MKLRVNVVLLLGAFLALFFGPAPSAASVLWFDITPALTPNDPIDQAYGDRITAAVMGPFSYGTMGGFTPNVEVSYGPTGPGLFDYVYFWDQDFGDLVNVIAQFSALANYGILEIVLTADPGFYVSLASFDLAGWDRTDRPINSVEVFDGLGNVLFSATGVLVEGDGVGAGHSSFSFGSGLAADSLRIRIDASNVPDPDGLNVGIDNITFSQIEDAPEPSALVLLGSALCLVGVLRRRRQDDNLLRRSLSSRRPWSPVYCVLTIIAAVPYRAMVSPPKADEPPIGHSETTRRLRPGTEMLAVRKLASRSRSWSESCANAEWPRSPKSLMWPG